MAPSRSRSQNPRTPEASSLRRNHVAAEPARLSVKARPTCSLVALGLILFGSPGCADEVTRPPSNPFGCTWFASPTGRVGNLGTDENQPVTLEEASERAMPGDMVCLLPGTYSLTRPFYPKRSGSADAYIVYAGHGGEAKLVWDGPTKTETNDTNMIHFFEDKNYLEIRGLTLDGKNRADANIKCHASHHIRIIGNRLLNGGSLGFGTKFCDYVHVENNMIYHTGYLGGWGSGISLNSQQWTDRFSGFHSYVIGNVISGSYDNSDHHTDGNGIILDLSNDTYNFSSADTPPVLVANNVVYQNGGRCIVLFIVTEGWIVNNTCYKNGLDGQLGEPIELLDNENRDSFWVNNVAYGWNDTGKCFITILGADQSFAGNASFNCTDDVEFEQLLDGEPIASVDPLFVDPLFVDATEDRQWLNAVPPWDLSDNFRPRDGAPLIDAGIDPRLIPGIRNEIIDGLTRFLAIDIAGQPRFQGASIDIGAYEVR